MQLYKHQQDIVEADPKKCGLFLGTGGGKTLTTLALARGKTLVICPKTTRDDRTWENNLKKMVKATHEYKDNNFELVVASKEEFRSGWERLMEKEKWFETVIIDEAHTVCGVSPTIKWVNKKPLPKTSQLFDACKAFLDKHPPIRLYLLTATPIRSPMSVLALGWLLGKTWDFYQFRSIYYVPVLMNMREIWVAKKDTETQERLGKVVQGLGYTGQLSDWVDVPEQTHLVKAIALTDMQVKKLKELPTEFPDPLVLVGKKHQVEQGVLKGNEFEPSQVFPTGKLEAIEDLYEEFGKVLVFAKYTEQIEQIDRHFFTTERKVYILNGQTKNRGDIIKWAEETDNCIVIAQSSVSAGYELPSFRCTVYASESYSYVDHAQSLGRTLRINNLQKNLYVYLVSGEIDKAVRKAIDLKGDFNSAIYAKVV